MCHQKKQGAESMMKLLTKIYQKVTIDGERIKDIGL